LAQRLRTSQSDPLRWGSSLSLRTVLLRFQWVTEQCGSAAISVGSGWDRWGHSERWTLFSCASLFPICTSFGCSSDSLWCNMRFLIKPPTSAQLFSLFPHWRRRRRFRSISALGLRSTPPNTNPQRFPSTVFGSSTIFYGNNGAAIAVANHRPKWLSTFSPIFERFPQWGFGSASNCRNWIAVCWMTVCRFQRFGVLWLTVGLRDAAVLRVMRDPIAEAVQWSRPKPTALKGICAVWGDARV
jgi:hypothetical protein